MKRPIVVIDAPTNLGLRPLRQGHVPGTWRAPAALARAGLHGALKPSRTVGLPRPVYDTEAQSGTRLRNGQTIRIFNLGLADAVAAAIKAGEFPVVVGGDCSILLGALAGARCSGPLSLVHLDGHSDFRHPGNYDSTAVLGAVAGMDLALATGRGETLLTDWPDAPAPLVQDAQAIQIGEREGRDPDFAWPDVNNTAITRIDVFTAREIGASAILKRTRRTLNRAGLPFWVHFDVDVMDQEIMPAVDMPGSPGIDPADIILVLRDLVHDRQCHGLTVTIFDPDLDPDGSHARLIVTLLRDVLRG